MSTDKKGTSPASQKKKGKVIKALFETEEHRQAEREYEEYYKRIRNLSRGV